MDAAQYDHGQTLFHPIDDGDGDACVCTGI